MEIRNSEKAQNGYRIIKWIGLSHFGTIFVFALVLEIFARGRTGGDVPVNIDTLRAVLVGIAIAIFFFAGWLRNRMLMPPTLSSVIDQALVPGERLRRMIIATALTFALCDAVAIFGLFIFFLGGARQDAYVFLALSSIFLIIYFPRTEQWHHWYSARGRFR